MTLTNCWILGLSDSLSIRDARVFVVLSRACSLVQSSINLDRILKMTNKLHTIIGKY